MVREGDWKYIYMANGGREQLFNLKDDPAEEQQRLHDEPAVAARLHTWAVQALSADGGEEGLADGRIAPLPFERFERTRIYQYNRGYGFRGFPPRPEDVLTAHYGPQDGQPEGR
jgi:choline-sulfatase